MCFIICLKRIPRLLVVWHGKSSVVIILSELIIPFFRPFFKGEKCRQKHAEFISEFCVFLFALSIGRFRWILENILMRICLSAPFFDFVSYFSSRGKAGKRSFSHWFDKSLYFSLKERFPAPFLILYPTFLREEKKAKETLVIGLSKVFKPPSLRKANTAFQSIQAQKPRTPGKQQQPDGFSVRLIFPAGCGNGGVGGLLQETSDRYFPSGFFL